MKNLFSMPGPLWLLLALVCLIVILAGLKTALKNTGWESKRKQKILVATSVVFLSWVILLSILSINGVFSDFSALPPRLLFVIIFPLPFVLAIAFSKTGGQLLQSVPPHWLVFMQSFRIFVELLILLAFLKNKLPVQMTFEGRNFDMLTGILALPVGYMLFMKKNHSSKITIGYNILGILLLLNILVIAMLSMPTPMRYFMNEPANVLVAEFPFVMLPGVLVPIAYSMHIFSLRKLLHKKRTVSPVMITVR